MIFEKCVCAWQKCPSNSAKFSPVVRWSRLLQSKLKKRFHQNNGALGSDRDVKTPHFWVSEIINKPWLFRHDTMSGRNSRPERTLWSKTNLTANSSALAIALVTITVKSTSIGKLQLYVQSFSRLNCIFKTTASSQFKSFTFKDVFGSPRFGRDWLADVVELWDFGRNLRRHVAV